MVEIVLININIERRINAADGGLVVALWLPAIPKFNNLFAEVQC